jgi:hypothetical protein
MIEYGASALGGLIVFGIGLAKLSPIQPGERAAEVLLAIISGLALLSMLLDGPSGAMARVAAFWFGALCGYVVYRLVPKRVPEPPRMSAQYHAATRRIDRAFEALKADAAGGVQTADLSHAKAHFREIERGFEELQREGKRLRSQSRQVMLAGFICTALFVAYLVVQYLMV